MRYGLAGVLVASVLGALVALQNPQSAEVQFFVFETSGSAGLVLILSFGIGIVVGLLGTLPSYLRRRRELKRLEEQLPSEPAEEDVPREAEESVRAPSPGASSRKPSGKRVPEISGRGISKKDSGEEEVASTTDSRPIKDLPAEDSAEGPAEGSSPPPVGSDPPSRMRRDSWWGALRERAGGQDRNDDSSDKDSSSIS